jgi:hypothetical protein
VPAPRGPRQAHAQGVSAHEELRQRYPQDQPHKGGPSPDNDDGTGAVFLGEDDTMHMIFGTLETA